MSLQFGDIQLKRASRAPLYRTLGIFMELEPLCLFNSVLMWVSLVLYDWGIYPVRNNIVFSQNSVSD